MSKIVDKDWGNTTPSEKAVAALKYKDLGLSIFPFHQGTKKPALSWGGNHNGLPRQAVIDYWSKFPNADIGCIIGERIVVIDADTEEAVSELVRLEAKYNCHPNMVAKTRRGQHHYFSLPDDIRITTSSFCTKSFPEKCDIRTGNNLILLPPSTNKSWIKNEVLTNG